MNRINRYLAWSLQAVIIASGAGWAGAAHSDPIITLLQSEAATILDENQVTLGTDGTAAGAATGPCFTGSCLPTPLGGVQLSYTSGNRNGQVSASASTSIPGTGGAQGNGTLPTGATAVPGGFALSDNSASATELGVTGSFAAGAAASWDTLTFYGAKSGQTGTLSLLLTLGTPTSSFTDVGTGGGCIAIGAVCDPFTNEITGKGATETLTETIALDQPLLVFNSLYAIADNDANIETTTIDPDLVLSLPAGVSFSAVSGNGGGSSSPPSVPEPDSLMLFGAAALVLALMQRRRSFSPGSRRELGATGT
jgi:PEP-CTERM motif